MSLRRAMIDLSTNQPNQQVNTPALDEGRCTLVHPPTPHVSGV